MTQKIKAIFFDLGDTLINFTCTEYNKLFFAGAENAYKYLLNQGIKLPSQKKYTFMHWVAIRWSLIKSFFSKREFNSRDVMKDCCDKLRISQNDKLVLELCWQFYIPLMKTAEVETGLHELIDELKNRDLKICIVSNTFVPGETLDRHLASEGLLEKFPDRVYSCDVGIRKPKRKIFEIACEKMQVRPENVLFVGDKVKYDIKGANRVGMTSVLKDPLGKAKNPKPAPDFIIKSLTEIPTILDKLS